MHKQQIRWLLMLWHHHPLRGKLSMQSVTTAKLYLGGP